MDIVLNYTCPASPPEGISVKSYGLGKDKQGYYLIEGEKHISMEIDVIKILFTPKDNEWVDIKL